MMNSLYISVAGMAAFTDQINVVSNNIANVGTTAYKCNNVTFADMLTRSIARTSGDSYGSGVQVQVVDEIWNQGTVSSTGNPTDLAINGNGFFVVRDPSTGTPYYTRDGGFHFDETGTLVDADGNVVQGYPVDDNGNLGAMTAIDISYENYPPQRTGEMSTTLNLNSDSEENDTFTTTTSVYDSLGNEIPVTITYTKTSNANEWNWTAEIPSEYGTLNGDSSGVITFDANGELQSGTDPVFDLQLTNGAGNQTVVWDLYDVSGDSNGSITQYSGESELKAHSQDGYPTGSATNVSIDENGYVIASYTNGESRALYQLTLADFTNYDGLEKTKGNLYTATRDSGQPVLGTPGSGKFGSVSSYSLEMSNVDLATELSKLITAQSAYQACSRAFSVTSEILDVLVNLK